MAQGKKTAQQAISKKIGGKNALNQLSATVSSTSKPTALDLRHEKPTEPGDFDTCVLSDYPSPVTLSIDVRSLSAHELFSVCTRFLFQSAAQATLNVAS